MRSYNDKRIALAKAVSNPLVFKFQIRFFTTAYFHVEKVRAEVINMLVEYLLFTPHIVIFVDIIC